jgi:phosphoglycerate dehydrogenase-like enzyme
MKVLLLTAPMPAAPFAEAIGALAPAVELVEFRKELQAELAEIDVVLGWQMPRGIAGRMPKLRWVCAVAAGVDKLLVEDLPATVPVSRIVDTEQADGIAQFVVLMALRHARALPMYEAQQRERRWRRSPVAAVRSRVLVLGTGAMGGVVARLLGAVGFQVQGWSRATPEPLASLLASSDIVVCALPLTPRPRTCSMPGIRRDAARQLPHHRRARRPCGRERSHRRGAGRTPRRRGAGRAAPRADGRR